MSITIDCQLVPDLPSVVSIQYLINSFLGAFL